MSLPKQLGARRAVETRSRMNAEDYEQYLEKQVVEGMNVHCEGNDWMWASSFSQEATLHGKRNNTIAIEYVESWSPEETNKVGSHALFEIGIENAQKAFPGHSFVVVPHISKNGNFHTHVLYCPVSEDGQKRMYSNFTERARWNKTVDETAIKYGLSTVRRGPSQQNERLSRSSRQILRSGNTVPYQLQIMQKADFARRVAISFAEFIDFMGNLGVEVNIRGKTISYLHSEKVKPVRGGTLGLNYQKRSLNKHFLMNEKEQAQRPALRGSLTQKLENSFDESGQFLKDKCDFPFNIGGHQRFLENKQEIDYSKILSLKHKKTELEKFSSYDFIKPFLKEASAMSIPAYCNKEDIGLVDQKNGKYRLQGREHILIDGCKWTNTKMKNGREIGTTGSLLEFVANQNDCSLLQSMAHITKNKKLLLLEQHMGEVKRDYKEFHVPKKGNEKPHKKDCLISNLVAHMGYKSDVAVMLRKSKNVKITNGAIDFLLGKSGTVKYRQDENKGWLKAISGCAKNGFLKQTGTKNEMTVYKDPFCFYSQNRFGIMSHKSSDNVLVLGDESLDSVEIFSAQKQNINKIKFIGFGKEFFSSTKLKNLEKFKIGFSFLESKEKSRGLELSL